MILGDARKVTLPYSWADGPDTRMLTVYDSLAKEESEKVMPTKSKLSVSKSMEELDSLVKVIAVGENKC